MFQQLRQGNPFYIFHKGENLRCEVGQVVSVSAPQPKYSTQFNSYMPPPPGTEMSVNVKVKLGDRTLDFEKLPATTAIADFTAQGSSMVVSSSREAIIAEVEAMAANSRQIVESVEYHTGVIKSCDSILAGLNPEVQEREAQTKRISELGQQVADINNRFDGVSNDIADLKKMLAAALSGGKEQSSARNPKN